MKARSQGAPSGREKLKISSKGGNGSHHKSSAFIKMKKKKDVSANSPVAPSSSLKTGQARNVLKKKR